MRRIDAKRTVLIGMIGLSALALAGASPWASADPPAPGGAEAPGDAEPKAPEKLREIRVAVLDLSVQKGVDVEGSALTDQINVLLAAMPKVKIVDRSQIKKVADEHKMVLTGLVDTNRAVEVGRFLSAQYITVGRASRIGEHVYVVLKVVEVETTLQTTISARATAKEGVASALAKLGESLSQKITALQRRPPMPTDPALEKVRAAAKPLAGKVVLVHIEETHVAKPLKDPAAQMAACNRLQAVGITALVPLAKDNAWREELLRTGKFGKRKIDYLLEGEGVSALGAEVYGLISCRARVELRLIPVPGNVVTHVEKGLAARVDLMEELSAKAALETAGRQGVDALLLRLGAETKRPPRKKRK